MILLMISEKHNEQIIFNFLNGYFGKELFIAPCHGVGHTVCDGGDDERTLVCAIFF